MDATERLGYAQLMLAHEMGGFADVAFFSENDWLQDIPTDPYHYEFGVYVSHLPNAIRVSLCLDRIIRPMQHEDNERLQAWLEYWVLHMGAHIRVQVETMNQHKWPLANEEIERRVEALMEEEAYGPWKFGHEIR